MRAADFSAATIRRLRDRVAQLCSSCDAATTVAVVGNGRVSTIGKAGHIQAASPGGPRYLASMTPEQRSSIDNAIWLCASCHDRIDNNPDYYPASLLRQWKADAEERSRVRQGQRLMTESEAQQLVVASLGGLPRHLPRNAIANLVGAIDMDLQSRDARFDVQTSYANKAITHTISAREPTSVAFTLDFGAAPEARLSMQQMLDHGSAASLPAHAVTSNGSPLISHIFESAAEAGGVLKLEPRSRPALLKLGARHEGDDLYRPLDDIAGSVTVGRRSFTYRGAGMGGVLDVSFRKHFDGDLAIDQCKFHLDVERWNGLDVRSIPYLDKTAALFGDVRKGCTLEIALELEGRPLLRGSLDRTEGLANYFSAVHSLLAYTKRASALATRLGRPIEFTSAVSFTGDEHAAIAEAVEIFDGARALAGDSSAQATQCTLQVRDEQVANLLRGEGATASVLLVAEEADFVRVFGRVVQLPDRQLHFEKAVVRVVGGTDSVQVGGQVEVEIRAASGSSGFWRYDVPAIGALGSALVVGAVSSRVSAVANMDVAVRDGGAGESAN